MINLYYLLIGVLPLENHWFWRYELFGTFTVLKVLGLVCLAGALVTTLQRGFDTRILSSAPIRFYLAYLTIQCMSYFVHGGEVAVSSDMYLNVVSILSLAITTVTLVNSPRRANRTLLMCIGGAGFASLYTIRGAQGASSISGFRPSGIFEDANYYALVVGMWIPLAFLWSSGNRSKRERMFCVACLGAMLLGTTFAASRGGFFGLAAALLFMIWHSRQRVRNLVVVSVVLLPLMILAPSSPIRRLLDPQYGDQKAQEARLIAWKAGLRMIRAYPLTGVGLGNFKPQVTRYSDPNANVISVAHNTYVETASELGLPALLIHLGIVASTFVAFGRTRRLASSVKLLHLYRTALGLQAGVVSYAVGALFVSSWWQKIPWLLIFLAGSLPAIMDRAVRRSRSENRLEGPAEGLKDRGPGKSVYAT